MEVQIPSPSVFLKKSPVLEPKSALPTVKKPVKPRATPTTKTAGKPTTVAGGPQDGAITKPKQSKSRNGCMTCKKKRLKCDETKPSCAQCQKRNVVCEGYKKDYKWRSFEETTFVSKPATKIKKNARSESFNDTQNDGRDIIQIKGQTQDSKPVANSWSPDLHSAFANAVHAFQGSSSPEKEPEPAPKPSPHSTPESLFMAPFETDGNIVRSQLPNIVDPSNLSNANAMPSQPEHDGSHSPMSNFSSSSPQLLDLLLPGTDLNQPPDPSEMRPPMSPMPYQPAGFDQESLPDIMAMDDDFDEEIIRQPLPANNVADPADMSNWIMRQSSPTPSNASSTSSKSSGLTILAQPQLDASSPEMLMLRFDKQTCGILSVKDGPTENPWRTLIWPLARDSPALYHAISSMTAFHGAHEIPNLHVPGMAHMTKSIKRLASEIENMRLDSALATSLALAFSEGWDRHISTGIQHLRGAKIMVNNAVVKHRRDMQLGHLSTQDALRLKFLCNTFVYMDVIARLTSLEEAADLNFEEILGTVNQPFGDLVEVDPLMGCATTLFPLIGRAANLIQRVRKTETNSLTIVSEAMELKEQLQQWQVPNALVFERPEDPNSEVQHSVQTAEAYRYATLLYLHQAVPEIPSDPSDLLAKRVLMTLASVPLSSRATIVQIFPLFAASCEVVSQEDRNWVMQRWAAMIARLKIGNVESCWRVVQEVWSRRDDYECEKANRLMRRYTSRGLPPETFVPPGVNTGKRKVNSNETANDDLFFGGSAGGPSDGPDASGRAPLKRRVTFDSTGPSRRGGELPMDQFEPEYTVRGELHWLGVMRDWDWEVFLG